MRYTYRQSTLGTLLLCPERGRLDIINKQEEETDATAIGTAFHSAVELVITNPWGKIQPAEAKTAAFAKFDELSALPHFKWVNTKTRPTVIKYLDLAVDGWFRDVYPQIGSVRAVEEHFEVKLGERPHPTPPETSEDDEMDELWISGTIDCVDEEKIIDWKTAGDERKYKGGFGGEAWKFRWAVQPTFYIAAWWILHGELLPFRYYAVTKGTDQFQSVDETRTVNDFQWLQTQLWSFVDLENSSGLHSPWPMNDQHALCSETWCPHWSGCKGTHYIDQPLAA
jgi:hypothetical protein